MSVALYYFATDKGAWRKVVCSMKSTVDDVAIVLHESAPHHLYSRVTTNCTIDTICIFSPSSTHAKVTRSVKVSSIIDHRIVSYQQIVALDKEGCELSIGNDTTREYDLNICKAEETVEFKSALKGTTLNLDIMSCDSVVFKNKRKVLNGQTYKRTVTGADVSV